MVDLCLLRDRENVCVTSQSCMNVFSNSPSERSGDFERSFDQLCPPGLFQRMLAADLAEILPWLPSVAFSLTMRCRHRFKSGFVARF